MDINQVITCDYLYLYDTEKLTQGKRTTYLNLNLATVFKTRQNVVLLLFGHNTGQQWRI